MPLAGLDMKRTHSRNGDDQPKWRPVTNLSGFVFSHPRKSAFFYGAVSSEGVASQRIVEGREHDPALREVYAYFLHMAGRAWELYRKWKAHCFDGNAGT
jgi:hypothetical protein